MTDPTSLDCNGRIGLLMERGNSQFFDYDRPNRCTIYIAIDSLIVESHKRQIAFTWRADGRKTKQKWFASKIIYMRSKHNWMHRQAYFLFLKLSIFGIFWFASHRQTDGTQTKTVERPPPKHRSARSVCREKMSSGVRW